MKSTKHTFKQLSLNSSKSESRLFTSLAVLILFSLSAPGLAFGFTREELATPPDQADAQMSLLEAAQSASVSNATAQQLADAMDIPTADIISVSLGTSDSRAAGVATGLLGDFFPTQGNTFAILATGFASTASTPNSSGSTSTQLGGLNNSQGEDLVRLSVQLSVPSNATCLSFEFAFYSEEFPEWVGSQFNDAFIAELGGTNFQIINNQVVAPLNFAFDTELNVISVNTVFGISANTGTTYDGTTPLLRASTPVEPDSTIDVVFSIQDLGDSIYDSAVFLDNLYWGYGVNCEAGVEIDADGDALLDDWEINGLDVDNDGIIDVDLPAMGADPQHKDVFVEIDYMVDPGFCFLGFCGFGHSHQPAPEAIEAIVDAFADAPVSNPDGTTGIRLHVDSGPNSVMNPVTGELWGALSRSNAVSHDDTLGTGLYNWSEFDQIKDGSFSITRGDLFHYCTFAHDIPGGFSGIARGIPEADFIVSLGQWTDSVGTVNDQAGTFMHELGHTLGLMHGGGDGDNNKPNYLSIMNYAFQFPGLRIDGVDANYDYSQFDLPDLDENNLDETVGLNGGAQIDGYGTRFRRCTGDEQIVNNANNPINWDGIGDSTGNPAQAQINRRRDSTSCNMSILESFDDWEHIVFNGGSIGLLGDVYIPPMETAADCTTVEDALATKMELGVTVAGGGEILLAPGGSTTYAFTITNSGENQDSYLLDITSSNGWADVAGNPSEIQLEKGEIYPITIPVTVPFSAGSENDDNVKVSATSTSNPNLLDTAIGTAHVASNPPIADAGPDQLVECAGSGSAVVTLDGSGSTVFGGATLDHMWTGPFVEGGGVVYDADPAVTLPLGVSLITLIVNDGIVDSVPDTATVTVQDTTPPDLSISCAPDILWPPNHKMVEVVPSITVNDICCGPDVTVELLSIQMDEGETENAFDPIYDADLENGFLGDDIQIVDGRIFLRSERAGKGNGRIYTITYQATDCAGNISTTSATVTVPHDMGE